MRIHKELLDRWSKYAHLYLAEHGYTVDDVLLGTDAWHIAHKLDFCREAYAMDRSIVDAHIQTALENIFPNCVFKEKKRY